MLSSFFPPDRLESYRTSPYKDRIDRIGRRLVEQRYHPVVTAQHLREWLRVTRYLQAQKLRLPLALDAPEVARYVTDRVVGLSDSRTRFVRAAVRIFVDADKHGYWRRRIGRAPRAGAGVVGVGSGRVRLVPARPPRVGPADGQHASMAAHTLRDVPRPGRRDPARGRRTPSRSGFPDPAADAGRRHAPDLRVRNAQLLSVGRHDGVAPPRPECRRGAAPSTSCAPSWLGVGPSRRPRGQIG